MERQKNPQKLSEVYKKVVSIIAQITHSFFKNKHRGQKEVLLNGDQDIVAISRWEDDGGAADPQTSLKPQLSQIQKKLSSSRNEDLTSISRWETDGGTV